MKKPVWFQAFDLVTIGGGAFVSFGLLAYALLAGIKSPHAKEGICLLATVGLAFLAIYLRYLFARRAWLREFTWCPSYGFMIHADGYSLPPVHEVERIIQKTVDGWSRYHAADYILRKEINWVYFDKTLNERVPPMTFRKCKGYTINGSHFMAVDYDHPLDELEATAFAHEIGHVIRGNATGQWIQEEHHKFAADHGLP